MYVHLLTVLLPKCFILYESTSMRQCLIDTLHTYMKYSNRWLQKKTILGGWMECVYLHKTHMLKS